MVCDDKGWCMLAEGWWVLCDARWGMHGVWWLKDNVWWQLEDVCCMLIEGWWVLCDVRWMMCVVWWIYYIMAKGCVWWRRHGVCFVMAEGCWVLCHGRVVVYDDKGVVSDVRRMVSVLWWQGNAVYCLITEGRHRDSGWLSVTAPECWGPGHHVDAQSTDEWLLWWEHRRHWSKVVDLAWL